MNKTIKTLALIAVTVAAVKRIERVHNRNNHTSDKLVANVRLLDIDEVNEKLEEFKDQVDALRN